jgi:hypothetical protein
LSAALARYEDLPAIAIPWLMFGFSGHKRRPEGLVIENYTTRAPFPPPRHASRLLKWKSIVDPMQVGGIEGPHFFVLSNGSQSAYDENRVLIPTPPDGDDIDMTALFGDRPYGRVFRLNHYFTRSEEEFARKTSRPASVGGRKLLGKPQERVRARREALAALIEAELVEDNAIQRFLPDLRRLVGMGVAS